MCIVLRVGAHNSDLLDILIVRKMIIYVTDRAYYVALDL